MSRRGLEPIRFFGDLASLARDNIILYYKLFFEEKLFYCVIFRFTMKQEEGSLALVTWQDPTICSTWKPVLPHSTR